METQATSILLLADDCEALQLLRSILEDQGYVVRQSSDAGLALGTALRSAPDLILVDVVMATTAGYAICVELKADPRTAGIPVMLITAQNDAFDKARAFAVGAVDYLAKPFDVAEVLTRVGTHVTLRRVSQEREALNTRLQAEIAERKQTEEALHLSEARYHGLAEYQPELICRFHHDTTLSFVNDAYCAYFGRKRDSLIGHPFLNLIWEDDHPEILGCLSSLTPGKPIVSCEHQVLDSEGQLRWQHWTVRLICDTHGQVVELQATGRDITERKQAEDALRASQTRYRALVHHFPNGAVFLFDHELRFLIADGMGLAEAGLCAEDLEGKMLAEALPPDMVARLEPFYRAVLAGHAPTHVEAEYDGRVYSFEAVPLRNEHDEIVAGMLITQDVTEHRRYTEAILGMNAALEASVVERTAALTTSLQALEESQRFSEQLARASPALLVLYDVHNWEVVYANRDPATVLGYSPGHTLHFSISGLCEVIHPDDVPQLAQLHTWTTLADDDVSELELRIRRASGEWCWFILRGSAFARNTDGRVMQLLITALDVTARRKVEEEILAYHSRLVQVQDAERAHIARELHDEVGQILTVLNLTLGAVADAEPATVPDRIHHAQAQVRELTAQVRQLSLNLRPVMLDDLGLLAAVLWHAERFSEQTGVQVDVQHGELTLPLSPEIAMTAYRVSQEALTNVARHAEVSRATVQLWTVGQFLYVQVTDAGRGFDVEAVLAHPVSSGLFGMRERVRLVGGTLSIESAVDSGTQVMAELPIAKMERSTDADPAIG